MPGPTLRLGILADLAALGADLPSPSTPARARARMAQGHGQVFSDFSGTVAPSPLRGADHGRAAPDPDEAAMWEERAAIAEYEGRWPRVMAEAIATRQVGLIRSEAGPEAWASLDRELLDLEGRRASGSGR